MTQDNTSSIHGKEIATDSTRLNVSSPYSSHHSDHPGLVLISKPLNGNNYSTWKRAMTLALNSKNKLGFVDGTINSPSKSENPDEYAAWSRCNDMVHSWIINTLDSEISDSVIYYATANEVWEDLRERFSQSNAPRIFEIQRDIAYFRQDQLSVSAYYTKLKGFWDELSSYSDAMHGAQHDQQKLMQFLMGLNDSYGGIRGQILLMSPLPSIHQAYSSVSQEEKQRLLSLTHVPESTGSAAMAVRSNNGGRPISRRFDRTGSQSFRTASPEIFSGGRSFSGRDYSGGRNFVNGGSDRGFNGGRRGEEERRRSGGNGRGRPSCTHCGQPGHWVQSCFQLRGYPAGHGKARPTGHTQPYVNGPAVNQVESVGGSSVVGLSEAQLQQLLSLLDIKNEGSSSQTHTVTKPGSGYEEDDWFG